MQKLAAFNSLIFRVRNIGSNSELLNSEMNYIKAVSIDRGFSLDIIDRNLSKSSKVTDSVRSLNSICLFNVCLYTVCCISVCLQSVYCLSSS